MRVRLLTLASLFMSSIAVSSPRPIQPEDIFKNQLISGPRISPDGKKIVFTISRLDGPNDRYASDIWIVNVTDGEPRRLSDDGFSSAPVWSPDGSMLVFSRSVVGRPQLFAMTLANRGVRQLTNFEEGAIRPLWSHDGRSIAFAALSKDAPPPARVDFAAAGFTPKGEQQKSDIRIIDAQRFQMNGVGYVYDRHQRLWTMNADGTGQKQLIAGDLWSEDNFAWSPDDRTIAFTSLRRKEPIQFYHDNIYTVASDGGPPKLLQSTRTRNTQPFFLTGHRLGYFAQDVDDISAEYPALLTSDIDGRNATEVVAKNQIAWGDWVLADMRRGGHCGPLLSTDGKLVLINANRSGVAVLIAVDLTSGKERSIGRTDGESYDCSMSADGKRIAYIFSDFLHPPEVHLVDIRTGRDRAVTAINKPFLDEVLLSRPQKFSVTDAKGFKVDAWFMPAVGPAATGPRPTLLNIHGGPQMQFGSTFFQEMQYWAGQGYNVVMPNPQGSIGYGYAFQEALVGDWGTAMFDDITRVMDVVVRRPDVDVARLGVIGGSYGGYAALWSIAHTNRFRVAVAERPASNLATLMLASDMASSNAHGGEYAWGKPWDPTSRIYADSPLTHVESVHTPLMLLHSANDTETPRDQALAEFSALKQLGREVVFVDVPNEDHGLSRTGRPIHRVERLHILSDWIANHMK